MMWRVVFFFIFPACLDSGKEMMARTPHIWVPYTEMFLFRLLLSSW